MTGADDEQPNPDCCRGCNSACP